MSKKLWLSWGTLLVGLSLWLFIANKGNPKAKKERYSAIQRAALSILARLLLKPWAKKIIPLLFQ
ncbi:MAG: hypothetical protein NMK33_05150 [Candidatus Cardinium sp.]|uniref:hypothetical protein n=1 Tax=Cardinium endosymbiont of Dermatophagoides farinae TaxID=2597823 RepID=UPI0011841ABA|nr:hypothetical protein [Cardinium endosymbiont of Dermatophagoides farinae]TSJ80804.1 hypothetical protein FPG78_01940 [Cardinium endosymbiont of Dermatophagoides farinae]UWW96807.1 MAG: hypothetical protein NMK33_05150 [Candidatus Cardinium sp.]